MGWKSLERAGAAETLDSLEQGLAPRGDASESSQRSRTQQPLVSSSGGLGDAVAGEPVKLAEQVA